MKSPKARCRIKGCMSCVPPEGYYSGMPQSHCPRCGMKTWCAMEGVSDFEEPSYPLPDWHYKLFEIIIDKIKQITIKPRKDHVSTKGKTNTKAL